MDRRIDLGIAFVTVVLGLVLLYLARQIPVGLIKDPIGPRGMPTFVSIFFIVAGSTLVAKRLLRWRRQTSHAVQSDGTEDESDSPASAGRAFATMGAALGYIMLLPILGFLLTTPLVLAVLLVLLGRRSPLVLLLVPVGYTVFVYVVFTRFLLIRFPEGIMAGLF